MDTSLAAGRWGVGDMEIVVVGSHRAVLGPERATLHFSVAHESEDMESAVASTARLANMLRSEIEDLKAKVPTAITWFAVLPVRTRSWRPYNKDGLVMPLRFGAVADIQVKFSDFAALAAFAARAGAESAVSLRSVEWALTEETRAKLTRKVLVEAVKNARDRALLIAQASGVDDVAVVEVADPGLLRDVGRSGVNIEGASLSRGAASSGSVGSGGLDLAPEDIEIAASVHARFVTRP